jgi:hypothetical protein
MRIPYSEVSVVDNMKLARNLDTVPAHRVLHVGGFVLLCFGALGCGSENNAAPRSDAEKHIQAAATLISRALMQGQQEKTPANMQEMKSFIQSKLKPEELKDMGVDNIDKALTSPRDSQMYVLVPGVNIRSATAPGQPTRGPGGAMGGGQQSKSQSPSARPIVLYEAKGSGGRRLVAYVMGGLGELDESTLKEQVPSFTP